MTTIKIKWHHKKNCNEYTASVVGDEQGVCARITQTNDLRWSARVDIYVEGKWYCNNRGQFPNVTTAKIWVKCEINTAYRK